MAQINLLTNKNIVDPKNEEYYNALRTNIQFLGKDKKVIVITSTSENEGKSTVSINLAISLAKLGLKTILVDADTRKSVMAGRFKFKNKISGLTNYLSGVSPIEDVIYETDIQHLNVIPAGQVPPNPTGLLQNKNFNIMVEVFREYYDYVIIDCPPSLGLITLNSLTAASGVIIPVQTEYYALEGLSQLMNTFNIVKKHLNSKLDIFGVLLTMTDSRTNISNQVGEQVREHFKGKAFNTVIARTVRLSEAPSFGEPIIEYAKNSNGAKQYLSLAKEVIERG